ncbi:MAG TPA: hypothetical protein VML91_01255 [Burkholderiales bacterium]|nr:hypothetical protein [Burkholderiales bacterium]
MCLKVLGAGALLAATTGAPASDLLAVNFAGTTPFHRADQSNGLLTTINPAAARDIGDLTSDQNTTVWGVTLPLRSVSGGNSLVTFDPASGNVVKTVPITGVEVSNIRLARLESRDENPVREYHTGLRRSYRQQSLPHQPVDRRCHLRRQDHVGGGWSVHQHLRARVRSGRTVVRLDWPQALRRVTVRDAGSACGAPAAAAGD